MSIHSLKNFSFGSFGFSIETRLNFCVWLALFLFFAFQFQEMHVCAEDEVAKKKNPSVTSPSQSLLIGIEGVYRSGHWTGIRRDDGQPIETVRTRDGDGVEVIYRQADRAHRNLWSYVIPGSEAAPLIVESSSLPPIKTRFPALGSPSLEPAMIPLSMPWVVAIGDALGIDQLNANKLLDRDASVAVSRPKTSAALPDSELGYCGVSLIVLSGSGQSILSDLSKEQQEAIISWVQSGGRALFAFGSSATDLFSKAPWLKRLVPLQKVELGKIDPSSLETFTSSQTPLEVFDGLLLPMQQGSTLLMGRTISRKSTPIAVEYNAGLGQVIVINADLEDPIFAKWPERMDFLKQIVGHIIDPSQELSGQKNRSTAYDDLAGQLRTTLDQFEIKKNYSFSFLSLIILAFLAFIGPLDFLLINRFLGKPILGWISLPVSAVGLCIFLVFESRPINNSNLQAGNNPQKAIPTSDSTTRDSDLVSEQQWNRLEVIDIDTTIKMGMTRSIHYLYSHESKITDMNIVPSQMMNEIGVLNGCQLTTPFGYPGESFGGIQIGIEDSRLPPYRVQFGDNRNETSMQGMPIASRSSKGFESRLQFKPSLTNQAPVTRRPGSELLQGKLTNPINVDILNGMLIYRNWTYLLPTRFPAGSEINSLDTLRQKNFRWQLSRQQALESSTETEPWNPADTTALDRISEMLLFHEAAGGTRYTNLKHAALSSLDLSHVLTDDRCILFGQLENAATKIDAQNGGDMSLQGRRQTFLRVIIPVKNVSMNR